MISGSGENMRVRRKNNLMDKEIELNENKIQSLYDHRVLKHNTNERESKERGQNILLKLNENMPIEELEAELPRACQDSKISTNVRKYFWSILNKKKEEAKFRKFMEKKADRVLGRFSMILLTAVEPLKCSQTTLSKLMQLCGGEHIIKNAVSGFRKLANTTQIYNYNNVRDIIAGGIDNCEQIETLLKLNKNTKLEPVVPRQAVPPKRRVQKERVIVKPEPKITYDPKRTKN